MEQLSLKCIRPWEPKEVAGGVQVSALASLYSPRTQAGGFGSACTRVSSHRT